VRIVFGSRSLENGDDDDEEDDEEADEDNIELVML
jgi:hypothetical protein